MGRQSVALPDGSEDYWGILASYHNLHCLVHNLLSSTIPDLIASREKLDITSPLSITIATKPATQRTVPSIHLTLAIIKYEAKLIALSNTTSI
jgi:hypothetical protein